MNFKNLLSIQNFIFILVLLSSLALLIFIRSEPNSFQLVLKRDSLGPLSLSKETIISESYLKRIFPDFNISYEIGTGDSPDFHYFQASSKTGELLFTISSFLEYEDSINRVIKDPDDIRLDVLTIYTDTIKDQYGIKVGDRYQDILEKRGKNLLFGAAHHDVTLVQIVFSIIFLPLQRE